MKSIRNLQRNKKKTQSNNNKISRKIKTQIIKRKKFTHNKLNNQVNLVTRTCYIEK